jgi:hypothetical protein
MANAKALGIGWRVVSARTSSTCFAHKLHVRFYFWALRWLRDACCRTTQRWLPPRTVCSVVGVEMATEPKNQRLPERYRQVLEVLAVAPQGRGVNALLTIGFKLETIADLIRSELATVRLEATENHDSRIEVARVRIADAGWRALEGLTTRRRSPRRPNGR